MLLLQLHLLGGGEFGLPEPLPRVVTATDMVSHLYGKVNKYIYHIKLYVYIARAKNIFMSCLTTLLTNILNFIFVQTITLFTMIKSECFKIFQSWVQFFYVHD